MMSITGKAVLVTGAEHEEGDIFADPLSQAMAESWRSGAAKALERENAALVP